MNKLEELQQLSKEAEICNKCPLWKLRTNVVFGEGNADTKLMFIGEAPGYHEDQQGKPFVGAAGKLLTELIDSLGFKREEVYITNVLKCRPPDNRDPLPEEVSACSYFLKKQIEIIDPKILCALGRNAAFSLLNHSVNMSTSHGKVYQLDGRLMFVTYHPAAALYHGKLLENIKKDFLELKKVYETKLLEDEKENLDKKEQEQLSFW
ncbi:MAG TPA: uracil-DNA glycosylase [Dictyoglomaceae bacterium]|nr:uracil-DNA glycosylase [Dictyoglomaceae bacterium]HOL39624.1 uracil-DNA glycosylase [Dictyoglomaceae bacterium]HOP95154.1 uracil-DNA glycosylase [Dictyoglomaceae bacterium]HPP15196.1 uracil-DNA glycosylase [Dictyoglomaceae bacterium]HPU42602.1 uracil-DNA glycosylase [Dictyoglomaceae bacterium]